MHKLISVLLVMTLLLTLGTSTIATQTEELPILSELPDEDIAEFLTEHNVHLPTEYRSWNDCIELARITIEAAEQDSNARFHYGFKFLQDYSDAIIAAVRAYYGDTTGSTYAHEYGSPSIVQDNIVLGTWQSEYEDYNCYGYAVGYYGWMEPGQIADAENGYAEPYPNHLFNTAATAADLVEDDLSALGYDLLYSGTLLVIPSGGVTVHTRLICVRITAPPARDFHFMQYVEDGSWYHKPGASTPLSYKYTPSSDRPWVLEGLDNIGYFRNTETQYVGDIYFISYTKCQDADFGKISCGNDLHIETCSVCGRTKGQQVACTYRYQYSSNNKHIATCTGCGTSKTAMPCIYQNNICKICGHRKIEGGIIQSLDQNKQ